MLTNDKNKSLKFTSHGMGQLEINKCTTVCIHVGLICIVVILCADICQLFKIKIINIISDTDWLKYIAELF